MCPHIIDKYQQPANFSEKNRQNRQLSKIGKFSTREFSIVLIQNLTSVLQYEACMSHFYHDIVNFYQDILSTFTMIYLFISQTNSDGPNGRLHWNKQIQKTVKWCHYNNKNIYYHRVILFMLRGHKFEWT